MNLRKMLMQSLIGLILKKTHVFVFQISFYFTQKKATKNSFFQKTKCLSGTE